MKNKKGFTLIELITTFVILAIILTIGVVSYYFVIEKVEKNYYKTLEQELLLAGNEYYNNHRDDKPLVGYNVVNIDDLVGKKYIESLKDRYGNECENNNRSKVYVYKTDEGYDYEACLVCNNYETEGGYCSGDIPDDIIIDAEKVDGSEYNTVLSYNNTSWTNSDKIIIDFAMTTEVIKYTIVNNKTGTERFCESITSSENDGVTIYSCNDMEISETGEYKVTAYNGDGEVIAEKEFNVKIDTEKPVCRFSNEPSSSGINIGDNLAYTIVCTDNNGFSDYLITKDNIISNNDTVLEVLEVSNSQVITNGYSYRVIVKVNGTGDAKISLQENVVSDLAGNTNIKLESTELKIDAISISQPVSNDYCNDLSYDGTMQVLTKTAESGYSFFDNYGTDVGTYTVKAILKNGYVWSETNDRSEVTFECSINKLNITYTAESVYKHYDGDILTSNKGILTSGSLVNGHTATITTSGSITNVGKVDNIITDVVIKDASGQDVTSNYEVNKLAGELGVAERILTVLPDSGLSKEYGENDPSLTYTIQNTINGEVPGVSGILSRDSGEKVGSYPIIIGTLELVDNDNFKASNYQLVLAPQVVNFKINGNIEYISNGYTGDYDGESHSITVNVTKPISDDLTITYSNSENGEYTLDNPKYSDAGIYTVWYKISLENVDDIIGKQQVVINKIASENPKVTGYNGVYDGNEHGITVEGGSGGIIYYSTDGTTYKQEAPTRTNAGTTNVWVKIVGDRNHNDTTPILTTIVIDKNNSECRITSIPTLEYPNKTTGEITYICTGDGDISLQSSNSIINISDEGDTSAMLTATSDGNSTITVRQAEGTNYKATDISEIVNVKKGDYTLKYDCSTNGGAGDSEVSVAVNDEVDLTKTCTTNDNLEFIGWNTNVNAMESLNSYVMPASNVTLYAIYVNKVNMPTTSTYCNNLIYNGQSQILTKEASAGYTFKDNIGTDADDYEITASLDSSYKWSDGTTSDITFTCTIAKREVTYKADDASKVYDGTALTKNTATLTSGILVSGHTASFTITGSITNVGTATNVLESVVIKSGSDDVSDNDTINKQNGTLTVTKEGITKPSASSYCNNLTYNGQSQTLTKDASTGYLFKNNTGTDAGDYEVTASLDGNYKWSDGTTSDITFTCIISKKIVTYKADDASKMYDGTALTKDTASLVDGGLVSGQYAAFTINGSITNVGTTTNKLTKVVITDNGNNDVSDNYNITLQDGTLTIIAATASKPTSSYCNDLTYNGQSQMLTKEAGVGYVFNGNTGITAKEYEIVASLNDNYIWDDKTNNDVIFYCSIAKADITGLTASITGANLIVDDKGNSLIANVSSDITDVTYNYEWYYNENGEVGGNKIDSVSQTITLNDNMLANYIVLRVSASKENYNDAMITVVTNESDNTYALVHKSLTYNVYFDPNGTTIEDSSGTYTSTYNLSCNYIGTTISGECEITTPTIVSETKGYVWGLENSNISINPGEILVLNDDNNGYTYLAMIDLGGAIEDSLVDDYVYGNVTDNYVWYSGKLWRIVGINSDGSIKMVTQYNVSSVSWYTSISTNYSTSHIRSWLNNEFLPTLYDADKLLVDYNWDYTADSSVNTSKPTTTSYVTEKVGLLTTYDFAKTGGTTDSSTSNSFLENGFHWWTMTPEVSGSSIWRVSYNGAAFVCKEGNDFNIKSALGVRPVVNLIPGVKVTGGTGTKNDPFIISGDKKFGQDNDLLNTRLSGEYVKFDNYLYRIVGIEEVNGKQLTKVTSYYTKVQYAFSSSGDTTFSKTTGVGYKLNSWYTGTDLTDAQRAMIATDTDDGVVWYQGPSSGTSWDYAKAKTGTKIAATVGLGRYGELFTGALTNGIYTYDFWTMTRYNISKIWYIHYNGNTRYDMELTEKIYALPSFYFKSDVLISSGSGKSNDPYILKME